MQDCGIQVSVQICPTIHCCPVDDPVAVTPSSQTRLGLAEVFSWDMLPTLTGQGLYPHESPDFCI